MAESLAFVQLSDSPMRFPPVDSVTAVFFDEAREQLLVFKEGSNAMDAFTMQPVNVIHYR